MTQQNIELDIEVLQKACEQVLVEHKTLAELAGLSSEDLERVYETGLEKYHAGRPEEAITDFTYLVMHQPWDRRFHLAFASTLHWLGEFQHALTFYGYALVMDACDPASSFRMAQCFLSLENEAGAIEALQMAIAQSYIKPEYDGVGEQAKQLLSDITC